MAPHTAEASSQRAHLTSLPPELLTQIITHLPLISATCLSLTCTHPHTIYKLYRRRHGIRIARLDMRDPGPEKKELHAYLREWIGKKFIYGGRSFGFKYVTRQAVARHFGTGRVREKTIRGIERRALRGERVHVVFHN